MDLLTILPRLALGDCSYAREVYPGVHAFTIRQAMNRVRAHHAAVLGPPGARAGPFEYLLVGHIHVNADKRVERVEGFNGTDGARWAEHAFAELGKHNLLTEGATVNTHTPIRDCPAAMATA